MRIALMTGENRQQQRAEHVALARRIRAGERQRAVRHPAIEQAALLQKSDFATEPCVVMLGGTARSVEPDLAV